MNSPIARTRDKKNNTGNLIVYLIMDAVGTIMFGLGFYSKTNNNGDALHPFLNDSQIQLGLIVVGAILMIIGVVKIIQILVNKARDQQNQKQL